MPIAPRRFAFMLVPAITCFLSSTSAFAQVEPSQHQKGKSPSVESPKDEPPGDVTTTESVWYGYQTLLADGVSALALGVGVGEDHEVAAAIGVLGFLLGGPTVHAVHGRHGIALGSLGLRVGWPVLGFALGYTAATPCEWSSCSLYGAVGILAGMASAIAIDASLFSWESRPMERSGSGRAVLSASPTFDARTKTGGITLTGRF
jgi:hypothetical protein